MVVPDRHRKCGIIVLGSEPLSPETLQAAAECDEVFVVARAVPGGGRWIVDEERAHSEAQRRLADVRRFLEARGVTVRGFVGDSSAEAARWDAEAVFPGGVLLTERRP